MRKPLIVGLIGTNDSGKSLIRSIFSRNVEDEVFISFNITGTANNYMFEIQDELENGHITKEKAKTWIEKYGCDLLPFDNFKKYISRETLREIYSEITDRNVIYVHIQAKDFEHYCDVGCYLFRDLRACWMVTNHRNHGLMNYIWHIMGHFHIVNKLARKDDIMFMKFEDLINDQEGQMRKLFKFFNIPFNKEFIPSTKPYTRYFTMIDLLNMNEYTNRSNAVEDPELDQISIQACDYNDVLGYPDVLRKEHLLPSTLNEDIDKYLKEIEGVRPQ